MSVEVKKIGEKAEVTITSEGKTVSIVVESAQDAWRLADAIEQQTTSLFGHRRNWP